MKDVKMDDMIAEVFKTLELIAECLSSPDEYMLSIGICHKAESENPFIIPVPTYAIPRVLGAAGYELIRDFKGSDEFRSMLSKEQLEIIDAAFQNVSKN